jgi:CubicO group peptidase (beta-lactamase class C family)
VSKSVPALDGINPRLGHKDRNITWRHLANQTSCYGVTERPGEAFDYSDYNMALFFDALVLGVYRSTHQNMDRDVLRPLIADPLACQDRPTLAAFGRRDRPGRLAISVRDFARFGLLYLRFGQWRDRRLVSAEHVKLVTASPLPLTIPRTHGEKAEMIAGQRSIGGGANQTDHLGSYSFAWWTNGVDRENRRHWPDAPTDAFAALGHDSMRVLVVIPSLDLVICWNDTKIRGREGANLVLRSIISSTAGR